MVDDHEKEVAEGLGSRPFDCGLRALWAARALLIYWLGDEWVERYAPDTKNAHPYFAVSDGVLGPLRFESRVVGLAELLLNMQDVPGFPHIIETLPKDNLEGAIAELQGAELLVRRGIPIEFLKPRPGRSYDVEAQVDGARVACEMKSKVEGKQPSSKSVENRLKKARTDQLPKDMPGVVMLRVPEAWTTDEVGHAIIKRGITDTFDRSQRISLVVVHWEHWVHQQSGSALCIAYRVYPNHAPRFPLVSLTRALHELPQLPTTWLRLHSIVCEPEQLIAQGYA
jgi:hypothetical protein